MVDTDVVWLASAMRKRESKRRESQGGRLKGIWVEQAGDDIRDSSNAENEEIDHRTSERQCSLRKGIQHDNPRGSKCRHSTPSSATKDIASHSHLRPSVR
jgi:hypothetical protein